MDSNQDQILQIQNPDQQNQNHVEAIVHTQPPTVARPPNMNYRDQRNVSMEDLGRDDTADEILNSTVDDTIIRTNQRPTINAPRFTIPDTMDDLINRQQRSAPNRTAPDIPNQTRTQQTQQPYVPPATNYRRNFDDRWDRIQNAQQDTDQYDQRGRPTQRPQQNQNQDQNLDDRQRQQIFDDQNDARVDNDDLESLINHLQNLQTSTETSTIPPVPRPKRYDDPPDFVTPYEQVLRGHQQEVEEQTARANTYKEMAGLMIHSLKQDPTHENADMAKKLLQKSHSTLQAMNNKKEGLRKAQKVRDYYRKPISQPTFDTNSTTYFNARDIISVTGYFDPSLPDADFKHVWMKLTDYGQLQKFDEKHYMQALTVILKKEAYETFCDMRERENNLSSIVDYFASVYAKKRSIASDRQAVDHFVRRKGESLITCMDRCRIAVERLRMTTSEEAWPEASRNLRRNILIQVIKEETARYIKMEEDEVYETTGLKYSFDKIVEMADRYERHHNATPKDEVSTAYRAASGGLIHSPENIDKLKSQLAHFKAENSKYQTLESKVALLEEELYTQAVRFKNDGRSDENKERRRTDFGLKQREARSSSLDRKRDLSSLDEPETKEVKMDTKPDYKPPAIKPSNPFDYKQGDSKYRTDEYKPRYDSDRRNSYESRYRTENYRPRYYSESDKKEDPKYRTEKKDNEDNKYRTDKKEGEDYRYRTDRPRYDSRDDRKDSPYPPRDSDRSRSLSRERYEPRDRYRSPSRERYDSRYRNNSSERYRSPSRYDSSNRYRSNSRENQGNYRQDGYRGSRSNSTDPQNLQLTHGNTKVSINISKSRESLN